VLIQTFHTFRMRSSVGPPKFSLEKVTLCSFQVMHSQATDYQVLGLDRDPQHQLLVSAAQHHQGSLCVTLHSLSGDNFFAYKVRSA
jgi:hypothetical protein